MIVMAFDQRWKDLQGRSARVIGFACQGETMRERDREAETIREWIARNCTGEVDPEGMDSVFWFYDDADATLARIRFG